MVIQKYIGRTINTRSGKRILVSTFPHSATWPSGIDKDKSVVFRPKPIMTLGVFDGKMYFEDFYLEEIKLNLRHVSTIKEDEIEEWRWRSWSTDSSMLSFMRSTPKDISFRDTVITSEDYERLVELGFNLPSGGIDLHRIGLVNYVKEDEGVNQDMSRILKVTNNDIPTEDSFDDFVFPDDLGTEEDEDFDVELDIDLDFDD
jgi:hypothetical protein